MGKNFGVFVFFFAEEEREGAAAPGKFSHFAPSPGAKSALGADCVSFVFRAGYICAVVRKKASGDNQSLLYPRCARGRRGSIICSSARSGALIWLFSFSGIYIFAAAAAFFYVPSRRRRRLLLLSENYPIVF